MLRVTMSVLLFLVHASPERPTLAMHSVVCHHTGVEVTLLGNNLEERQPPDLTLTTPGGEFKMCCSFQIWMMRSIPVVGREFMMR